MHPADRPALTAEPLPATRSGSRLALVVLVGLIALLGAMRAFVLAGQWLIVQDPLSAARAAVVFGGQAPLRAMEAATIYGQGWTREVWLTQGSVLEEDRALDDLQIERPAEHELSRRALLRLGVPESAIRVLPGRNGNTADEVRTIAAYLDTLGDREAGVILITSKPHSRRVRTLWHRLAASRPDAIVRYAQRDPFDADHWWRTASDASNVAHEWFGLLNAWSGFPISSNRRSAR